MKRPRAARHDASPTSSLSPARHQSPRSETASLVVRGERRLRNSETPETDRDEIFARQWPGLRRILYGTLAGLGIQPADREDVLQETALRLYLKWELLEHGRPVEFYAQAIAVNVWRTILRRRSSHEHLTDVLHEQADPISDPARIVLARMELVRLGQLIADLEPAQRKLLTDAVARDAPDGSPAPARLRMARMRLRRLLTI